MAPLEKLSDIVYEVRHEVQSPRSGTKNWSPRSAAKTGFIVRTTSYPSAVQRILYGQGRGISGRDSSSTVVGKCAGTSGSGEPGVQEICVSPVSMSRAQESVTEAADSRSWFDFSTLPLQLIANIIKADAAEESLLVEQVLGLVKKDPSRSLDDLSCSLPPQSRLKSWKGLRGLTPSLEEISPCAYLVHKEVKPAHVKVRLCWFMGWRRFWSEWRKISVHAYALFSASGY